MTPDDIVLEVWERATLTLVTITAVEVKAADIIGQYSVQSGDGQRMYDQAVRAACSTAVRTKKPRHVVRTSTGVYSVASYDPADAVGVKLDFTAMPDGRLFQWVLLL